MPHGYNVQLSTRFNIGKAKDVSNQLLSFSKLIMRPFHGRGTDRTWTNADRRRRPTLNNQLTRRPYYNSLLPFQQLFWTPIPRLVVSQPQFHRNYLLSRTMHKAQELAYPVNESREELKRPLTNDDSKVSCQDIDNNPEITEDEIDNTVREFRQWKLTELGFRQSRVQHAGIEFSLLSYNVLAQCLLEDNFYLYRKCQPQHLQWDYRKIRILRELTSLESDVVCLQEVQQEHFHDFFVPELNKLGYSGVYKKRTGDKNDGCAIFYKRRLFQLRELKLVEFCKPGVRLLDRDNVAMVALLRPNQHSFRGHLCVANTHLLFNPGRGDIKLAQLKVLLAEVDKLAFRRLSHTGKPLYHPVILCGDLNSEPHCYLYRFLSRGSLHYEGLTAGDISGQAEGSYRGRFQLAKETFSLDMSISNGCQYLDAVRMRSGNTRSRSAPEQSTSKEEQRTPETNTPHQNDSDLLPTGKISHRLNLVSAYNHLTDRGTTYQSEVTTQQSGGGCTVDYIFYSVQHKKSVLEGHRVLHKEVRESSLALLSTYGLLTDGELQKIRSLPNAALPSDHLPIVAKFLLRDS